MPAPSVVREEEPVERSDLPAAPEPASGASGAPEPAFAAQPAPTGLHGLRETLLTWRLALLVPGVAALAALAWAQGHPAWTEHVFSRGIYPWASAAFGWLPSLVPFSVAEWVVAAAVLAVAAFLACVVRRLVRAGRGRRAVVAGRAAVTALGAVSVAYFLFMLLFGLNYHRLAFAEEEGLDVRPSSVAELEDLCRDLGARAGAARAELGAGVDLGVYAQAQGGFSAYADEVTDAMRSLAQDYPALARPLWIRPKPVAASGALSAADIRGIFFPFTAEPNVNRQPPFYAQPHTMAHELAHEAGFAREDEANFIGYLACLRSDDALVRYSGLAMAYGYAYSALWRADPDAARAVGAELSEAVRADRQADAAFWEAWHSPLSDASQAANDAYLRANGQADGTQSYGRMVDLLLAERRASREG